LKESPPIQLRRKVAREAALLLYTEQEKEYKQAKRRAAQSLRVKVFPSNLEVAEEMDRIADENEGPLRRERLIQMRRDALQIMGTLKDFYPKLIGSVWRGTAHRNSDIDIDTFSSTPEKVLAKLRENRFQVEGTEWRSVTKGGKTESSFHIHLTLSSGHEAEIVVRSPENRDQFRKCEIYGDLMIGLNLSQLKRVLKENPLRRFAPNDLPITNF